MLRRYRHRRGPYAMAAPSPVPAILRSVILLAVILFLLYLLGSWILGLFGGNTVQARTVTMDVESGGRVSVSFDGGLLQPAADRIKLHEDDKLSTSSNGHARLQFFDGSYMRVDEQTDVTIGENEQGTEESEYSIDVEKGALWVRTPDVDTFSGTIVRTITMPRYTVTIPSDAEAVVEDDFLLVFSADGLGIEMTIPSTSETLYIGEGQQIRLPEGGLDGDISRFRSAIDPLAVQREFIEESRTTVFEENAEVTSSGSVVIEENALLTVTTPTNNMAVQGVTVNIEGRVATTVDRVRINGYIVQISSDGSFDQELSLTADDDMTITVEALDERGIVLAKETRTVIKQEAGSSDIPSPTITTPAGDGETYQTQSSEVEIRGTVPASTAGVMVNDYTLQLFRKGNTSWSYLASTALGNMQQGTNTYDIYALNDAGEKSEPVRITIIVGGEGTGVVSSEGSISSAASSSASSVDEASLPNNTPLLPGTVTVTGPTPGSTHTATGSEFLLEGTTPTQTASVWVNGYKLQLYEAGKTFWNYIANTEYGTLKRGENTYRIVARNADNEILDIFTYTVTYNP